MKIHLRNPRRELEIAGPMKVHALLERLEINPESVLVIRGDALASNFCRLRERAAGGVDEATAPVTLGRAVGI